MACERNTLASVLYGCVHMFVKLAQAAYTMNETTMPSEWFTFHLEQIGEKKT